MRTRKLGQRVTGQFKSRGSLLARDRGKRIEELFEAISGGQVVDQVLERNPRAAGQTRSYSGALEGVRYFAR